jgi:holin-like protein
MTETLKALGQLALLWAIYAASSWVVRTFALPVPANVLGVLTLFALLCLGVVKMKHVELAADFLLKHLVFFFVPITAGLLDWGGVFADYGLALGVAIVVSSALALFVTGRLSQALLRRAK